MKIVLKTGQEYDVSGLFQITETQICISFTGIEDYGVLRSTLTDEALKEIKYYTDETSFTTYEEYAKFIKSNVVEMEDGLDIAMYFERDNEVVLAIKKLQDTNEETNDKFITLQGELDNSQSLGDNAIAELTIMMSYIFTMLTGGI